MEPKWIIRAYRDGDEEGILELWKAVYSDMQFDREKWLRWWRWMYKENPAGNGWIWLAEDEGKIVGHEALIPIVVKIGNRIVKVAQAVDLMVHPDYRYQGMFLKLERTALNEAEHKGLRITIGFSNKAAYQGHIKLGWFAIGRMSWLIKPLNWVNAIKLKVKNRFLQVVLATGAGLVFNEIFWRIQKAPVIKGFTITQITSFDERFDEFWSRICDQSQIMVVRNKAYLNWRYSTPDANYSVFAAEKDHRICGYIVLHYKIQNGVKRSTIFDVMATSEEIVHCLISRAIAESRQKGMDVILYSSITNKTYHGILKKNGFMPLPFINSGHFSIYSSSPSISKEFLSNPQNWLVQTGDSDAV
jgi:GNAT superfamily N-acetyltransferase